MDLDSWNSDKSHHHLFTCNPANPPVHMPVLPSFLIGRDAFCCSAHLPQPGQGCQNAFELWYQTTLDHQNVKHIQQRVTYVSLHKRHQQPRLHRYVENLPLLETCQTSPTPKAGQYTPLCPNQQKAYATGYLASPMSWRGHLAYLLVELTHKSTIVQDCVVGQVCHHHRRSAAFRTNNTT